MLDNKKDENYLGKLAFVLHAHLPYVRKSEKNSLEEDWLFQAILESYLPLLQVMESSEKLNNNAKLTISLSPTLLSLLNDPEIKAKFPEWIMTRIDLLNKLSKEDKAYSEFLLKRLQKQLKDWERCQGDLIIRFKNLSKTGFLDIMTCAATHGYLPILRENEETVIGQIKTAIHFHENIFEFKPLGIWLPECAYYENLDNILLNCGIRYAVLDGHGILNSKPRPRYGVYAPICSRRGVAFFGRDSESTLPVWSSREGFPGHGSYREFHKDLGWEMPLSKLKEKGISSSRPLGLKFHRITNSRTTLGEKDYYREKEANNKAKEDAENYLLQRSVQLKTLKISSSFNPILVAPFDAELFGHWWYEGPIFLNHIFKNSSKYAIKLTHLREILTNKPQIQICDPSPSSWGQGGYHNYWLNDKNSWIVPEISKAGKTFTRIVSRNSFDAIYTRILKQAARELLLAQSSDWSFILRAGTTTELARDRINRHLSRFWKLIEYLEKDFADYDFLKTIEEEDRIFPEVNISNWEKRN